MLTQLSENEMNNSLAAKLHQVERGLSTKHATKWRSLLSIRFDSLLFTTSISVLGNLKLEKSLMQNKSLIIREINLLLNSEKQCNSELSVVFFVNILADFFVTRGERLT